MADVSDIFFRSANLGAQMFSDVRTSVDRYKALEEETRRWEVMRQEREEQRQLEQDMLAIKDFTEQTNSLNWWKANGDDPQKLAAAITGINEIRARRGLQPIAGLTDIRRARIAEDVSTNLTAALADPIAGDMRWNLFVAGLRETYGDAAVDNMANESYMNTVAATRKEQEERRRLAAEAIKTVKVTEPLKEPSAQTTAEAASASIVDSVAKMTGIVAPSDKLASQLKTSLLGSGITTTRMGMESDLPESFKGQLSELPENATAEDRMRYLYEASKGRRDIKTLETKLATANTSNMTIAELRRLMKDGVDAGLIALPMKEVTYLNGGSSVIIDEVESMRQFMTPDRYEEYKRQKTQDNLAVAKEVGSMYELVNKMAVSGASMESIKAAVKPYLSAVNAYALEMGMPVMTDTQFLNGIEGLVQLTQSKLKHEQLRLPIETDTAVANLALIQSQVELNKAQAADIRSGRRYGRGGGGGGGGMAGQAIDLADLSVGAIPSNLRDMARNPKTGVLNVSRMSSIGTQYYTTIFGTPDMSTVETSRLYNLGMSNESIAVMTYRGQTYTGAAVAEANAMITKGSDAALATWLTNPEHIRILNGKDPKAKAQLRELLKSSFRQGTLTFSERGIRNLNRNLALHIKRVHQDNGYATDSNAYNWADSVPDHRRQQNAPKPVGGGGNTWNTGNAGNAGNTGNRGNTGNAGTSGNAGGTGGTSTNKRKPQYISSPDNVRYRANNSGNSGSNRNKNNQNKGDGIKNLPPVRM